MGGSWQHTDYGTKTRGWDNYKTELPRKGPRWLNLQLLWGVLISWGWCLCTDTSWNCLWHARKTANWIPMLLKWQTHRKPSRSSQGTGSLLLSALVPSFSSSASCWQTVTRSFWEDKIWFAGLICSCIIKLSVEGWELGDLLIISSTVFCLFA